MLRRLFILLNLAIVAVSSSHSMLAQGTFQDLNFEEANPALIQQFDEAPALFPGWELFDGNTQTSVASYDELTLGSVNIGIMDGKGYLTPFQGNYMAVLQAVTAPTTSISVSLEQTGVVPTGTQWIELDANQSQYSSFVVSFNGTPVSMVPIRDFANYTLYGGNISAWAGQDATLGITELSPSNGQYSPSLLQLDDIMFSSSSVIPEPDPLALMGVGGFLFALYRRFAPKG